MAAPLALLGIGLAAKALQGWQAYQREQEARDKANELARTPVPRFAYNPRLLGIYQTAQGQAASPQGFTGAEKLAYEQGVGRAANTARYNATQLGGGSAARAIAGLNNINQVIGQNQFAMNDAQLARARQNAAYARLLSTANTFQGIDNMNTQTDLNRRLMAEQAAAEGIRSNRDLWQGTIGSLGSDLIGAGAMGLIGGKNATEIPDYGYNTTLSIPNLKYSAPLPTSGISGSTYNRIFFNPRLNLRGLPQ